jgi:hypothetical protein
MKLPQKDQKTEHEYVAAFIRGICNPRHKNDLIKELLKTHASRAGQDGKVEILCDWEDVGEGLQKIGLIEVQPRLDEGVGAGGPPPKRKKMTLIPTERVDPRSAMR